MTLKDRLTPTELLIVMHIANGKSLEEIAAILHRSRSNVSYHIGRARQRAHANNLPHLVSIAIATGDLIWEDDRECRTLSSPNGAQRPRLA
jgi:DNA-binding CsgD family transcriptional regulator